MATGARYPYVVVTPIVDGQLEHRIPERFFVARRIRARTGLNVPDQIDRHVVWRARPEHGHRLRSLIQVERRWAVGNVRRWRRIHEHRLGVAGYHAHVSEKFGDLQFVDDGDQ